MYSLIQSQPVAPPLLLWQNPLVLKFGMSGIRSLAATLFCTKMQCCRRRATGSQVSRPNSTRAAGAGGSTNTMLKLYTDDSPGLRVYVTEWIASRTFIDEMLSLQRPIHCPHAFHLVHWLHLLPPHLRQGRPVLDQVIINHSLLLHYPWDILIGSLSITSSRGLQ